MSFSYERVGWLVEIEFFLDFEKSLLRLRNPCFVWFFVVDVGGSFREEGVLLFLVLKEKGVHNIQAGFHPRFFSFLFACQRSEHDTCLDESKDLLESWEVDSSFLPGMS